MKYSYYIPIDHETTEDAQPLGGNYACAEEAAEAAAEYIHDNCDGWDHSWPIIFAMIDEAGRETLVRVEMQFKPSFYGQEIQHKEVDHD